MSHEVKATRQGNLINRMQQEKDFSSKTMQKMS